ncbi:MAG TPA: hypothetical protein VJ951_12170 [Bacteroidales bacterium]|nr:hypothetical protein [Bacteroidales bacterium]
MKNLPLVLLLAIMPAITFAQLKQDTNNTVRINYYLYGNQIGKPEVNPDQKIHKPGRTFYYRYQFTNVAGQEQYFVIKPDNTWHFVDAKSENQEAIKDFQLKVRDSKINFKNPAYYQRSISYHINKNIQRYNFTGVIENRKNIWIHPPRAYLFKILELNPFPYIKYPLQVGSSYKGSLRIGSGWGDERWKTWSGIIENQYNYEVTARRELDTPFGRLNCYVIASTAVSELGETKLTTYFNKTYGFVKLEYTNIDNSRLVIELYEIGEPLIKLFDTRI